MYNGSWGGSGALLTSHSPATGRPIARVRQATVEEYEACVAAMIAAQADWQLVSGVFNCFNCLSPPDSRDTCRACLLLSDARAQAR